MAIKVGDKVSCSARRDYSGQNSLADFVWNGTNVYDVIQIDGDRVVIGKNGQVTAAVKLNTVTPVTSSANKTVTENVPVASTAIGKEDTVTSQGIEAGMRELMNRVYGDKVSEEDLLKYNMRLFGIPHQFTEFCDYRTYSPASSKEKYELIGRKFIENIMLEAPVVTIIPGEPVYLPAAKDKTSLATSLLQAANNNISALVVNLSGDKLKDKLRYYDFKRDYLTYMRYVNVMCAVSAAFLDLQNYTINGEPLTKYQWENYRWNGESYGSIGTKIITGGKKAFKGAINKLSSMGSGMFGETLDYIRNHLPVIGADKVTDSVVDTTVSVITEKVDEDVLEQVEDLLTETNFVQFYVESDSGVSESSTNTTAASKLQGMFDTGTEWMKYVHMKPL